MACSFAVIGLLWNMVCAMSSTCSASCCHEVRQRGPVMSNLQNDPDPKIENFTIKLNQQRTYATRYKEDEKRTHRTSTTKGRKRIRLVCLARAMYVVPNPSAIFEGEHRGGCQAEPRLRTRLDPTTLANTPSPHPRRVPRRSCK